MADQAVNPVEQAELVTQLRAGNDAAYERLVRETTPMLLAVARRFLRREEDAQDAVQEAFVSAFKSLERFDGRSKLSTWLHRITVNNCLMKLRSLRRKPERSIDDLLPRFKDDGHPEQFAVPWNQTPQDVITALETRRLVRAKIDELPENYRQVLLLRDIEGLDTEEAAAMLGANANTVKIRLHRARLALRELLAPHISPAERGKGGGEGDDQ